MRAALIIGSGTLGLAAVLAACQEGSTSVPARGLDSGPDAGVAVSEASTDATTADVESLDAGEEAEAGCDPDAESPSDLACTGLYADWTTKTIAPAVMPYTPSYVLWSDGAEKSRWIYLPEGSSIDTSDMDDWTFPVGTKVWKEFRWPEADAAPTYAGVPAGQRIETRLLWKRPGGWDVLIYRWSDNESTATLFLGGAMGVAGTTYEIPGVNECYDCHQGRQDFLLGFDLIGIGAPGAQGVTLAALADAGRLTVPPPATSITIPEDKTGLSVSPLGFLHVNCGVTCHNSNCNAEAAGTEVYFKLLADQLYPEGGTAKVTGLDTYKTTVNVTSTLMPNGMTWVIIDPGNADASLLPHVTLARDPDAGGFKPMPPLVSHIPDPVDVAKVEAWINAL